MRSWSVTSTRLRQLQKSGEANMQFTYRFVFFFSQLCKLSQHHSGGEGWWRGGRVGPTKLLCQGDRRMHGLAKPYILLYTSALPHLPPNHCSGNPRQHILNSNTDCQGYLTCAGSSPNNGSSKNNTICLVSQQFRMVKFNEDIDRTLEFHAWSAKVL